MTTGNETTGARVPVPPANADAAGTPPACRELQGWLVGKGCIGLSWRDREPVSQIGGRPREERMLELCDPRDGRARTLALVFGEDAKFEAEDGVALVDLLQRSEPAVLEALVPMQGVVFVAREDLRRFVHDVRNALNSMLMNAGVVASAERARPDLASFVEQMERSGAACAARLRQLSDRYL